MCMHVVGKVYALTPAFCADRKYKELKTLFNVVR